MQIGFLRAQDRGVGHLAVVARNHGVGLRRASRTREDERRKEIWPVDHWQLAKRHSGDCRVQAGVEWRGWPARHHVEPDLEDGVVRQRVPKAPSRYLLAHARLFGEAPVPERQISLRAQPE